MAAAVDVAGESEEHATAGERETTKRRESPNRVSAVSDDTQVCGRQASRGRISLGHLPGECCIHILYPQSTRQKVSP